MSRDDPQFKLRLPIELRDRIEQAAKESKRSLNAEMVARLEMSFAQDQGMEVFSGKLDEASVELLRRTSEVFKRLLDEADKEAGKK